MAANKGQKTETSLEKAAFENPAISDYRKSTRSFGVIAKGITVDSTEEVCSALAYDVLSGTVDLMQGAFMLKALDTMLTREDQTLRREEMAHRLEMRAAAVRALSARRQEV